MTFEAVAQAVVYPDPSAVYAELSVDVQLQQCQGVAGMIQQLNTTNGQIRDTQKCSAAMQLHNRVRLHGLQRRCGW